MSSLGSPPPELGLLDGAAEPEAGDTGELVGLRGRADLNGKRVEVESRVVGKDGAPRFMVRVLGGGIRPQLLS